MCIAYDISLRKKVTVSLSVLVFALASIIILSPASAQISIPQILTVPQSVTLSVESADMSGTAFPGQWVELWQDGIIVQEDFTPFTATVDSEIQYDVFIYDDPNESKFFDHWEDGSTNPTRQFAISSDAAFTAFFSTGSESQNSLPVANDDDAATDEDVPVVIDVMVNDNLSGLFSVASVTEPSNGAATINADNTITYLPDQDFFGSDFFEYTVSDSTGLVQDSATVFVTINPVNDAPVAADDDITTDEDTTVSFFAEANDSDVDGDEIFVASVEQGANGSAEIASNGAVVYTPNPDFNGGDSFVYVLSDVNGATDTGTISVTINPINDAPIAADDSAPTSINQSVTVDVLANDSDADGDSLSITSTSNPANGTATINANNTITYSPDQDFAGNDSFSYTISDGNGEADSATVSVTVPTYKVIKTISTEQAPRDVQVNHKTNMVYVSHATGKVVTIINGTTKEVERIISAGGASAGLAVNPQTNMIYVTELSGNSIYVINGTTGQFVKEISTNGRPWFLAVNPQTNMIYVHETGYRTGAVSVIDAATNTIQKSISVGRGSGEVGINSNTNKIYVASYADNTLYTIDGNTNAISHKIKMGGFPYGIGIDQVNNKIYVSDFVKNIVSVIDGKTNSIFSNILVGEHPGGVEVNQNTNKVFVANSFDNTISVIDGSTDTVSEIIAVDARPRGIGVNQVTGEVYVTNLDSNKVTVLSKGVER